MNKLSGLFLVLPLLFLQTADEIASKTEANLRSYSSFQAEFKQFYYSTTISTPLEEQGKVYFKKPDMMKWEYEEPEKKIFLLKGKTIQFYDIEENQLIQDLGSDEQYEAEILSLLSGRKGLLEHYIIELSPFPSENKNSHHLKLLPKSGEDESYILLEIDQKSWLIQKAVFFDWAGNKTEFHFTKIKKNIDFDKTLFELKLPPGVEIIKN